MTNSDFDRLTPGEFLRLQAVQIATAAAQDFNGSKSMTEIADEIVDYVRNGSPNGQIRHNPEPITGGCGTR